MVKKYVKALEERQINPLTDEIWTVNDVPNLWKIKVLKQIEKDGYIVLDDGTVGRPEGE